MKKEAISPKLSRPQSYVEEEEGPVPSLATSTARDEVPQQLPSTHTPTTKQAIPRDIQIKPILAPPVSESVDGVYYSHARKRASPAESPGSLERPHKLRQSPAKRLSDDLR